MYVVSFADSSWHRSVLQLPGGTLKVNADIHGEMLVEILDTKGHPLAGYGRSECASIRFDGLHHTVRWGRRSSLEDLRGTVVSLRFLVRDGDLYSFWFEP